MSKRKRLVVLLILLLYVAVVWTVCWLVQDFTWIYALLLTACGVTVTAVYWLVSRLAAQATPSPAAPATTAARADVPASDPDFQAVQALLSEANGKLAKSALLASERVRPTVSDLPVYVIAGTEGSGKTATFLQAGLAPEALAGQVFRGTAVIPTQVANFWFAKGALIAEASGRFFSDDSGRWARFLAALRGKTSGSLLRKLWGGGTPKNNLGGIVLFVDSNQFVGIPDASRLPALARATQERLRLASEMFAADTPVWVVFSKADSIPFFRDYFTRLRDNEDQQPLGCTLDLISGAQRPAAELYAEAETQRLGTAFNTLYQSLAHHRLTFLARESDSARKPGVYEFPRELKRVRGVMIQFLVDAFRPNPLQPGPLLRGFYFTGKRPVPARAGGEGMLLDRSATTNVSDATSLLNAEQVKAEFERAMARGGAAPPPPAPMVDRWCFVSQLFHEVVRTGPAQVHRYGDRRFDLYRRLAFGGIICLCALLALGVLYSTWNNRQLLSEVGDAAIAIQNAPEERDLKHLDDLDKLRARLVDLNVYDHSVPWPRLGFFLYRGDDVAASARTVYFSYFNKYMLEPVAKKLAGDLSGLPSTKNDTYPFDQVYDGLGTYLRITEPGCPAEPPLRDALMKAWSSIRPANDSQAETIGRQFEFYVDERRRKHVRPLDGRQDAVNRGRDYLGLFDPEERVYRGLVEQVNQKIDPVRLSAYTTKAPGVLSGGTEMPGAFTHSGWTEMEELIKKADPSELGDSCVLGKSKALQIIGQLDKGAFAKHLRESYSRDYVRRWKAFLAGVKVSAYRDQADAYQKLQILEGQDSPLMWLLFMAHENGNDAAPASSDGVAARGAEAAKGEVARKVENSRFGRLAKVVTGVAKPAAGQPVAPPQDPKDALQPVHSVFGTQASSKNWNDPNNASYAQALAALRKAMNALSESRSSDPDVTLNGDAKKAVDDGLETVRGMQKKFNRGEDGVGDEVTRLLSEPFEQARPHFIADTGKANAEKLNKAGQKFCLQVNRLLQKYPFKSDGKDVASMEDVLPIFSPQTGALSVFYQQELSRFLALSGKSYLRKADAPKDVKIDDKFLEAFNRLMQISQVLFADGQSTPSMHFRLKVQPNPDVKGITLTMDGQTVAAGSTQQFAWSGSGTHDLKLKVQSTDADVPVASYGDPWGIFTMMAMADPRPPGSNDIALSKIQGNARARLEPITIGGKDIVVHLRIEDFPGGIEHAFDKGFFDCRCVPKVATQ